MRRPWTDLQLPIDSVLDALGDALGRGHAVLSAPPGSGKTTKVSLALCDAPWLAGRTILMLEPRRPAARLAAARMASLLGEAVGQTVGYQMRFERCIGPATRIQVLTEGVLTRRIQRDPTLDRVGLLIFDELHERTLTADLGLALVLDTIDALRPDLRILVMSATLDTAAVATLLGGAPVIQAEGRAHPVQIHYAERGADRERGRDGAGDLTATMVQGIGRALGEQTGDILAFLPGAAEIERLRAHLAARLGPRLEQAIVLLPLHGGLTTAEQDRALRPGDGTRRRILLATDIAETSVTIEGITTVVDSGLTRKPRFDPASGLTRLVTEPIALASAAQRAGRAGRQGPGTCYRLWTRAQEIGRPEHRPAEILQADLAPLALELALWGIRDPAELRWLDPPPAAAWEQAVGLLEDLGALDANGLLTGLGRRLAQLPVHPRLARLLAAATTPAAHQLAADLAALLSDRDPWGAIAGQAPPADLGLRLQALEAHRAGQPTPGVDRRRLAAAERLSRQLKRALTAADAPPSTASPRRTTQAPCSPSPIQTGSPSDGKTATGDIGSPPARAPSCRATTRWPASPISSSPTSTSASSKDASASRCRSPSRTCTRCWPSGSSRARHWNSTRAAGRSSPAPRPASAPCCSSPDHSRSPTPLRPSPCCSRRSPHCPTLASAGTRAPASSRRVSR